MAQVNEYIRYEPDERPPHSIAAGVGFQAAVVIIAPVVLSAIIIGRVANQPESYLTWIAFAALLISGVSTILQAVRVGRIGAGHVLVMGTSGAFIAVCITALVKGGTGPDGEPDRRLVAVSVCLSCAAFAIAPDPHTGRLRHGDHADRRHGHADRFRLADGCARGYAVGRCYDCGRRDARYACGVGAVRPRGLATVGTAHQYCGGLRRGCPLWTVQHSARNRSALDRFSRWRVAGIGPDVQCRILGAAAGVCGRNLGRRD